MPLTASTSSASNSTPAPAGAHIARCVRVIDLGTQVDTGQFGTKVQPKVIVSFELPNEKHVFKEENGEEPFLVSAEWTMSLTEKANMRKALESWRGRPFTDEELKGFNVGKLAGAPCMLNVIHQEKNGKTYARIASISPLPRGMQCPPAILEVLVYDVDDRKNAVYGKLPDWIRNKIDKCENWKKQAASAPQESTEVADHDILGGEGETNEPF